MIADPCQTTGSSASHDSSTPLTRARTFDPTEPISVNFRAAIDAALSRQIDRVESRLAAISAQCLRMTEIARALCAGGKRIRPAFAYWGHVAASDANDLDEQALLNACAAFELLHVGVLVHDDLIDGSQTRRGLPAAHRAFAADHPAQSADYGQAQAVILGDEIISWADEALLRAGLPADQLNVALTYWFAVRTEVNAGQFLDIANQFQLLAELSAQQAADLVLETKTAKYTVVRPLQFGAALAGGDEQLIAGLAAFGNPLGRAFQLRDDLLGVFADPQQTGKPAGDDLREGKATVLLAAALDASPHADELRSLVGDRSMTDAQLARARKLIVASGAVQHVEATIEQDWTTAQRVLAELPISSAGRTALGRLAELSVHRSY